MVPRPIVYFLAGPNVRGDFYHTFSDTRPKGRNTVLSGSDPRIYRWFSRDAILDRRGRWEGVNLPSKRLTKQIHLADPIWMHCDIKSNLNYFLRSERTNWRENGDFDTYPTLEAYIRGEVLTAYGVDSLDAAAEIRVRHDVLRYLAPYSEELHWPYPKLARLIAESDSGYVVAVRGGNLCRSYKGVPDTNMLIEAARDIQKSEVIVS